MESSLEQRTMRKVYLRLLPFAMLAYFFCYPDRLNVGFAALTMNKAIGLTAAAYGVSAGAFYLGYCLFEVPATSSSTRSARGCGSRDHGDLRPCLRRHRLHRRP
jgi:sugar phosphate permease